MKKPLIAILAAFVVSPPALAREMVIAATGETHGALLPCECPLEPDGGLARRAAFIRSLRAQTLQKGDEFLLLDVGGNAAGGPYDTRPFTRESALARSDCIFQVMSGLGYDAVALADDELAWGTSCISRWTGQIPFVLWNGAAPPLTGVPKIRIIERNEFRVGVTALSAPVIQPLSDDVPALEQTDAVTSAMQASAALGDTALKILICHVGEEASRKIASQVPGFSLILNAHARRGTTPCFFINGVPVAQFSYETRKVPVIRFAIDGPMPVLKSITQERLSQAAGEDEAVAARVAKVLRQVEGSGAPGTTITLFTMPYCPYSRPVEKKLLEALPAFGASVRLDIRYIVNKSSDGKLTSLHGEEELAEARRRAAVKELYPSRFHDFLRRINERPEETWEVAARAVGMVPARIRGAVETGEADRFLDRDIALAQALHVLASPTVLINNLPLSGESLASRALKIACTALPEQARPALCRDLPECFSDADCRKPGMEVRCLNPGEKTARCEHEPAVRVPLTIVFPEKAIAPIAERIKEALVEIFPGLELKEFPAGSASADVQMLLAAHPYNQIPALFFGPEVKQARGYSDVASTLVKLKDTEMYVVIPAASGANFFFKRPRDDNKLDLFVPLSTEPGREAITTVLEWLSQANARGIHPELAIHPTLYEDKGTRTLSAPGGKAALEEALRAVAVSVRYPDKYRAYLQALANASGTGYWEEPLLAVGLDPNSVKKSTQSTEVLERAAQEADLCGIAPAGAVSLLIANQELLVPSNPGELLDVLQTWSR